MAFFGLVHNDLDGLIDIELISLNLLEDTLYVNLG